MGIYLEIARKAVAAYRREETERRARERREQISEIEGVVTRHYSAKLEGGTDAHESLIEELVLWNPHFTAGKDMIEEAVRAASKKAAEAQDLRDTTTLPTHQKPHEGSVDQGYAENHWVERDGTGTGVQEADEPEVDAERLSEEPAGPAPQGDTEVGMTQVTRVAEVLRQHWERINSDADELIEEGFFHDKLDFDPTIGIVEEAQCMLLLPEE